MLDLAWDVTDHVSVHSYYDPAAYDSFGAFLACSRELDAMLATVTEIADFVAEAKGSTKRIGLSVDEWNVWRLKDHMAREAQEVPGGPFRSAPALAEDEQDLRRCARRRLPPRDACCGMPIASGSPASPSSST